MRRPSAMGGGATYSVPVLRRTAGVPSPSPQPPSSPPLGARKGEGAPSPSPQPPSSPPLGARKGEGAAFPSPWPPSSPPLGARKGEGAPSPSPGPLPLPHGERRGDVGGWRESMVARARNSCVLGARASGPHLDGWNRGALVAALVLRRTAGVPSPSPQPPASPPLGARKGEGAPSPSPGPLPLPHGERKGGRGGAGAKAWWPAHAMVACWERGPLARILMDGTGVHWLQRWYCGARLACPHLPPSPLPLPRWGRGRGKALPHLPPSPFTASLVAWRARSRTGRGRFPTCPLGGWTRGHMRGVGVAPSPSPGPLPLPHGERKGDGGGWRERTPETAHAIVACWERGPLARILMDGTGEHWLQCQYCGARLAALTFPPAPFLSPAGGEEGGGRCLPFPLAPSAPLRGEEGGGAASPSPWPPFSSSMGAVEKERRKLLTQWLRAGRAGLWPAS